jgi:hypothetical protein
MGRVLVGTLATLLFFAPTYAQVQEPKVMKLDLANLPEEQRKDSEYMVNLGRVFGPYALADTNVNGQIDIDEYKMALALAGLKKKVTDDKIFLNKQELDKISKAYESYINHLKELEADPRPAYRTSNARFIKLI